jgi:uncharacterized protein YaeQ
MAIKSTIYKAALQIADMDRGLYADHALTLALHPSETEEADGAPAGLCAAGAGQRPRRRAAVRARPVGQRGTRPLAARPDRQLLHWIEVGQPDERRLAKACGRAGRVGTATAAPAPSGGQALQAKVARLKNLAVWQVPAAQAQALAASWRNARCSCR